MPVTQQFLARFMQDERGASLVEYTLLIGLITIAVVALIVAVGDSVETIWTTLNGVMANAANG